VRRKGKVVSFKTSYSGPIRVGQPAQEFRVVFDTGSGHVVLPAVECESEACLTHRRYNMTASQTTSAINVDGSLVLPGDLCDQVTIGFGTGEVTGEFVRERVCLGDVRVPAAPCVDNVHMVTAVEMSAQPFKSFDFDGIIGLGLNGLSLSQNFSFFHWLSGNPYIGAAQFATFLTDGEDGDTSEIAFGGHNAVRSLESLSWTPVVLPELGYWAVPIVAVRINGKALEVCHDGTCRGVVDTGTSHLGVPAPHDQRVATLLTRRAGGLKDCRLVDAPVLEIELPGRNLTLLPENYMRRLPLREDITLGSSLGVSLGGGAVQQQQQQQPSQQQQQPSQPQQPSASKGEAAAAAAPFKSDPRLSSSGGTASPSLQCLCRPRLMPVNLPAPLGPKVFILGEPVLHRYYTVFDWKTPQLGFGLAANRQNTRALHTEKQQPAV